MDPMWWRYNGACLVPARPELAERWFRTDQFYFMEPHNERSWRKHKAYFASLAEAWASLKSDEYPSVECLRKHALIRTGWYEERMLTCESAEAAERVAAFIRPMDQYAIVSVSQWVVRVWTARSQSYKAMGRADFDRSMDDVLNFVAGLIEVTREQLDEQGGFAA